MVLPIGPTPHWTNSPIGPTRPLDQLAQWSTPMDQLALLWSSAVDQPYLLNHPVCWKLYHNAWEEQFYYLIGFHNCCLVDINTRNQEMWLLNNLGDWKSLNFRKLDNFSTIWVFFSHIHKSTFHKLFYCCFESKHKTWEDHDIGVPSVRNATSWGLSLLSRFCEFDGGCLPLSGIQWNFPERIYWGGKLPQCNSCKFQSFSYNTCMHVVRCTSLICINYYFSEYIIV